VVDFLDNPDTFKLNQQNLFSFFSVLQQNGLSRTITLNDHSTTTVRQQIHEHVHQLMLGKHLSFSDVTFPTSLSENEEAPWQMIRGGNKVASGQLLKWADLLPHQMRTIVQILPTIRKVRSPLCTHDIILIGKLLILFFFRILTCHQLALLVLMGRYILAASRHTPVMHHRSYTTFTHLLMIASMDATALNHVHRCLQIPPPLTCTMYALVKYLHQGHQPLGPQLLSH
jgi:hypothetical protein